MPENASVGEPAYAGPPHYDLRRMIREALEKR